MKKRLAEGMTLMVLLLVLWNMAAHRPHGRSADKAFYGFFSDGGKQP